MAFPAGSLPPPGSSGAEHQYQQRSAAAQPPAVQRHAANPGAPEGGNVVDLDSFREHFAPLLEQHMAPMRQQLDRYNQQSQLQQRTLGRLQRVFSPDGESDDEQESLRGAGGGQRPRAPKPDPRLAQYGESLDHLLGLALRSERAGNPMPVTAQIGSEFYEFAMKQVEQNRLLMEKLETLQEKLERETNPRKAIWNQSMMDFDNLIRNSMSTIYGNDDTYAMQRDAQWDAVSKQIMAELKDLADNEPENLDLILRSPQKRRDMVTYFVKMNIPPRARQILENERLMNTRQTSAELYRAWQQAENIEDPRERQATRNRIRYAWREAQWEETQGKNRGKSRPGQQMLHQSIYGEGRMPAFRNY